MPKPVLHLTLPLINAEVYSVLAEYPPELQTRVLEIANVRQKLIAAVIQQLRWLYRVMIADEQLSSHRLPTYRPEQRLQVRSLVHQSIQNLLQSHSDIEVSSPLCRSVVFT